MKARFCLLFCLAPLALKAQDTAKTSATVLSLRVIYNDFGTAAQLKRSFGDLHFQNIRNMQPGIGLDLRTDLGKWTGFFASADISPTDYLFRNGSMQGSNKLLAETSAGLFLRLLPARFAVSPYLSGGIGASFYPGKTGAFVPLGAGMRFRLFNEAFISTQLDARQALGTNVTRHFTYSAAIGTSIGRKKKTPPAIPVAPPAPVSAPVIAEVPAPAPVPEKTIRVMITDEQTGLPLPGAVITLNGNGWKVEGNSGADGTATFGPFKAGDVAIGAVLNGIAASNGSIAKADFDRPASPLSVTLTHNDPRFTLRGNVVNTRLQKPEPNVTITVDNKTAATLETFPNRPADGSFSVPLRAGSDFEISAKKAGYLSSIGKVSTIGLNRSTVLYVTLDLEVEEAATGQTITLRNVYYDTGSSKIRADASSDLERLVRFLQDNPSVSIEIASHTDSRGSAQLNLALSRSRAREAVAWLVVKGIAKTRLRAVGYGESRPVNGCADGVSCTEEQHAQNRRTEFRVIP